VLTLALPRHSSLGGAARFDILFAGVSSRPRSARPHRHALRYVVGHGETPVHRNQTRRFVMLYWAAVFFVIALVGAVLGFSGIAAGAAGIAKILFFVFLVLGALSLIFGRRVSA
jgi:uncharacterized membrane protein YtjA (UPF0391 family)